MLQKSSSKVAKSSGRKVSTQRSGEICVVARAHRSRLEGGTASVRVAGGEAARAREAPAEQTTRATRSWVMRRFPPQPAGLDLGAHLAQVALVLESGSPASLHHFVCKARGVERDQRICPVSVSETAPAVLASFGAPELLYQATICAASSSWRQHLRRTMPALVERRVVDPR